MLPLFKSCCKWESVIAQVDGMVRVGRLLKCRCQVRCQVHSAKKRLLSPVFDFLILFLVFRRSFALGRGLAGELEALFDGTEEALVAVVEHGDDVGRT